MPSVWIAVLLVGSLCMVTCSAAGQYSILAPESISPGKDYKLSVYIVGTSGVNVAASLTSAKGTKYPNTEKTVSNMNNGDSKEIVISNVPATLKVNDIKLQVVLSGGISVTNSTALDIEWKTMTILVQTDKAKYKPGDTVKFRVMAVDAQLMPVLNNPCDIVVKDTKNDLFQWLKIEGKAKKNGVLSLEYLVNKVGILFGKWKISVKCGEDSAEKEFTVEKYVLPRFEVKITTPAYGVTGSRGKGFRVTVEAKYTFGEEVQGKSQIVITQQNSWGGGFMVKRLPGNDKEDKFDEKLVNGKAMVKVDVASGMTTMYISVDVVESLTGEKVSKTHEIKIYEKRCKVSKMELTPTVYNPGLDYYGCFELKQPDGSNFDEDATVSVWYNGCPKNEWGSYNCYDNSLTKTQLPAPTQHKANDDGELCFRFKTNDQFKAYRIRANVTCGTGKDADKVEQTYQVAKFTSANKGVGLSLKLVSDVKDVKAGSKITFTVTSITSITSFSLLVLSKGTFAYQKEYQINAATSYNFDVLLTLAMAPSAKFIVTYIDTSVKSPEVGMYYLELPVGGSFPNDVSVKFNKPQAELGEDITVSVTAAPSSYVGLLCVDKSVRLLATGNDLTEDEVLEQQRKYGMKKDKNSGNDFIMPFWRPWCIMPSRSSSVRQMLGDMNVAIMTGAIVAGRYNPYGGGGGGGIIMEDAIAAGGILRKSGGASGGGQSGKPAPKPRVDFPETWLWLDLIARSNGMAVFPAKVPDTITTWECNAFALDNKKGLGLAPNRAKLLAKKEFFTQLLLPYSIKNGEAFILKMLVHYYADSGSPKELTNVRVALMEDDDLEASLDLSVKADVKKQSVTKFIKRITSGVAVMVSIQVRVPKVGSPKIKVQATGGSLSDTVIKPLLVVPQGVMRKGTALSALLSLKKGEKFEKEVAVEFPTSGVVDGSRYVSVSVIGDIMGPALVNIGGMVKMPFGCGEQNMINFTPTMSVVKYLDSLNNPDPELKAKSLKYMEIGYTRELQYRHKDGCFSAFGESDKFASTWLTAFVMRSFGQATQYITISESELGKTIDCLLSKQNPRDGSYKEEGKVIHKDFYGGSGEGEAMYAYILIALLEYPNGFGAKKKDVMARVDVTTDRLENYAKDIIKKIGSGKPTDRQKYDLAIISYALALAGRSYADTILATMDSFAAKSNGEKMWTMGSATKCAQPYRCYAVKPNPSEVELASYALLAYMKRGKCSTSADCSMIVRYISSKQNPDGGFCSTKDTFLALQALAEFSAAQSAVTPNMKVNFEATGKNKKTQTGSFDVTSKTRTLLMKKFIDQVDLDKDLKVKAKATGEGNAILQVTRQYNEVEMTEYTDKLSIDNTVTYKEQSNGDVMITLKICLSQKDDIIKGMSIMEANCLSGFEPYGDLTCDGCSKMTLNLFEKNQEKFTAYLNDVSSTSECLVMQCKQTTIFTETKPAVVSYADYYFNDRRAEKEYAVPKLLVAKDPCKGCDANCKCGGPIEGSTAAYTTYPMMLLVVAMTLLGLMIN